MTGENPSSLTSLTSLPHGTLMPIIDASVKSTAIDQPTEATHLHGRFSTSQQSFPWESSSRPVVLILYTGGTLGMAPIGPGGSLAPSSDYLTRRLENMTEFHTHAMPLFDIFSYHQLQDSSNIECRDWCRLALDIQHFYFHYDGFVVAHGTDTMHYTATALSFALGHISKPVIVTGSSIPLKRPYNDARRNLATALVFAARPEICEVCICVNDVLLRGNRSIKVANSTRLFQSPNYSPLGEWVGGELRIRTFRLLRQPTSPLRVRAWFRNSVFYLSLDGLSGAKGMLTAVESLLLRSNAKTDIKSINPLQQSDKSSQNNHWPIEALILSLPAISPSSTLRYTKELGNLSHSAHSASCALMVVPQYPIGSFSPDCLRVLNSVLPNAIFLDDMTPQAAVVKAMFVLASLYGPMGESGKHSGDSSSTEPMETPLKTSTVPFDVHLATFRTLMVTSLNGEVTRVSDPSTLGQRSSSHSIGNSSLDLTPRMDGGRRWERSQWEKIKE